MLHHEESIINHFKETWWFQTHLRFSD